MQLVPTELSHLIWIQCLFMSSDPILIPFLDFDSIFANRFCSIYRNQNCL